jgi:hypothetical protein
MITATGISVVSMTPAGMQKSGVRVVNMTPAPADDKVWWF